MPRAVLSRLASGRQRAIAIFFLAALCMLVLWQLTVHVWPQPKVALNQHYVALHSAYSFSCPTSWRISSYVQPAGTVTTATYKDRSKTYALVISPPGQVSADADNLSRSSSWFTYGGMKFYRTVLSTNGSPFYVAATSPVTSYVITMQLPAKDANQYLSIFNQILGTLHFAS